MKTTTLTIHQRRVLEWLTDADGRILTELTDGTFCGISGVECGPQMTTLAQGLKAKRLIEQTGKVGANTAYRVSNKGRKVLKYNQEKRA